MKRLRNENGYVNKDKYDAVVNENKKRKRNARVSIAISCITTILFIVSTLFALAYSLEIYHWNPYEIRTIGFTTSLSNRELKEIATAGKQVEIVGYLTVGYNEDIYLTSKPYTTPYYLGSDEMALYKNIKVDVTAIPNYEEGDLVRATGYLTYDNFTEDINGTSYSYKLKLVNPVFTDVTEDLGSYYKEYKKFQDSGALNIITYCTTWYDYVITGCYYEDYTGIEKLDESIFDECQEIMESVDSELKSEYIQALNSLRDTVSRMNLLISAEDYSGIVAEVDALYAGFLKFDMITASVDISAVI